MRGPSARFTRPRSRAGRVLALVAAAVLAWSLAACSHPAPAKTSTEALSPAAEATTRSPGAPSPASATPSPPPLPAYCHQGGPELWAHLATCNWPGPTNTGPDLSQCPGGQLTDDSGSITRTIAVTKPHAVISCESIQGMLDIEAPNVTIENTVIVANSGRTGEDANGTAAITVEAGASAVVDHVKINGDDGVHACIWHQGTSLAVNAVNCFGADDGIFSWADSSSPGSGDHFVIKNSYFHGFTHATSNGHEDGYQTEGASFGLIKHNTYRMAADADSAIAIWDSLKSSSDIRIRHNLITGGGSPSMRRITTRGTAGPATHPPWVASRTPTSASSATFSAPMPVAASGNSACGSNGRGLPMMAGRRTAGGAPATGCWRRGRAWTMAIRRARVCSAADAVAEPASQVR